MVLTSSESELGCRGHRVALVKNHELHSSTHKLLSAAKALNLISDHIDATIITSVQLQGHVLVVFGTIDFLGDS